MLAFELAEHFGTNLWRVLEVEDAACVEQAHSLLELYALLERRGAGVVEVATGDELVRRIRSDASDPVFITLAAPFTDEDWRVVDRHRECFQREIGGVFVLSAAEHDRLARSAPNLASWIGGCGYVATDAAQLDEAGRLARREALSAQLGMTDEQVLQAAENGTLPTGPEFAEWLVLLNRGDLLGG